MAEFSQDQLRDFARIMLDEQSVRLEAQRENLIKAAVTASLAAWGIDADDEDELREIKLDRIHNRRWRKNVEAVQQTSLKTVVTVIVTGVVGAILMLFSFTGVRHG